MRVSAQEVMHFDPIYENDEAALYRVRWEDGSAYNVVTPDDYFYRWDYGDIVSEVLYMRNVGFVFCIDPDLDAPTVSTDYERVAYIYDPATIGLLAHGFPHNQSNIQQKYNISDIQAYVRTSIALKAVMYPDGFTYFNGKHFTLDSIRAHNDPYINDIIDAAYAHQTYDATRLDVSSHLGPYAFEFAEASHELVYNETRISLVDEAGELVPSNIIKSNVPFFFRVNLLDEAFKEVITTLNNTIRERGLIYDSHIPGTQRVAFLERYEARLELELEYVPDSTDVNLRKQMHQVHGDIMERTDLSGFVFTLFQEVDKAEAQYTIDGYHLKKVDEYVTDVHGHISFTTLDHHQYFIQETYAPVFAILDDTLHRVDSDQMTITNEYDSKTIEVQKRMSQDINRPLDTFEFGLYRRVDDSVADIEVDGYHYQLIKTKMTDENGRVTFSNLDIEATYYIKELSAPSYAKILPDMIELADIQNYVIVEVINDVIYDDVILIKQDGRSFARLEDAHFVILDETFEVVDTVITDQNGTVQLQLLAGVEYSIQEIQAPNGYLLDDRTYLISDLQLRSGRRDMIIVDNFEIEHPNVLPKTGMQPALLQWLSRLK